MLDFLECRAMRIMDQMGWGAEREKLERQARKRSDRRVLHGGVGKPCFPKASTCAGRREKRCGRGFIGPAESLLGGRDPRRAFDYERASARRNRALADVVAALTFSDGGSR